MNTMEDGFGRNGSALQSGCQSRLGSWVRESRAILRTAPRIRAAGLNRGADRQIHKIFKFERRKFMAKPEQLCYNKRGKNRTSFFIGCIRLMKIHLFLADFAGEGDEPPCGSSVSFFFLPTVIPNSMGKRQRDVRRAVPFSGCKKGRCR